MTIKTHLTNTIIEEEVEKTGDNKVPQETITSVTLTDLNGKVIKRAKEVYRYDSINDHDIISLLLDDGTIITFIIIEIDGVLRVSTGYSQKDNQAYEILNNRFVEFAKPNSICLYDLEKKEIIARITKTERGYQISYKFQIDETDFVTIHILTDKEFNITSSVIQIPELKLDFPVEDNCNAIELIKNDTIDAIIAFYLPIIKEKLAEKERKEEKEQRKRTRQKELFEFETMSHAKTEKKSE